MTKQAVQKTATEQPSDFELKVQKLREIYADANEISKTALENVIRGLSTAKSDPASGTPTGKRRPNRCPSGEGLGADGDSAAQAWRREADARVFRDAAQQRRQSGGRAGWHRSRHALGLPRQRHEATFRQHLRRRLGSLHRRLRHQNSRHPRPSVRSNSEGWPGVRNPAGRRLHREAPDPGALLVCSQSQFDDGETKRLEKSARLLTNS